MFLSVFSLIAAYLVEACCEGIWIGFEYDSGTSQYAWADGGCTSTYTNWGTNLPDNYGSNELYAAIVYNSTDGIWNDYETYDKMQCGCQDVTTPGSCATHAGWRTIDSNPECYFIHENNTDWETCEGLCTDISATMLCIEDVAQNTVVHDEIDCEMCAWFDHCNIVNETCCAPLWLGIEQETLSGSWAWSDTCSSSYANWNGVATPDHYAEDELYAVLGEFESVGTWYTAPAAWGEAKCGCQLATQWPCAEGFMSYNSSTFEQTCYYISSSTMDHAACVSLCTSLGANMLCVLDSDQNAYLKDEVTCIVPPFFMPSFSCFWHESHLREELVWYGLGIPCFIVMAIVATHMGLIVYAGAGSKKGTGAGVIQQHGRVDLTVVPLPSTSSYGRLLDMPYEASESEPEIRANAEVDNMVNTWLLRGAVAEMVFAIGLGGIGCTMILHNRRIEVSLYVDAIEGLVCFFSKLIIVMSSYKVYTNLSELSRKVCGYWIHVFALAKFLAGIASFHIFIGYMIFAAEDDKFYNFCLAAHFFYSALLSVIVFQTLTGVALYRIHIGAVNQIGDINRFYEVAGFWWAILVLGTFGVGIAVWLVGADFMITDDRDGFEKIGIYFSIASCFQFCAGAAIFCINTRVRAHFGGPRGAKTIQMMVKK